MAFRLDVYYHWPVCSNIIRIVPLKTTKDYNTIYRLYNNNNNNTLVSPQNLFVFVRKLANTFARQVEMKKKVKFYLLPTDIVRKMHLQLGANLGDERSRDLRYPMMDRMAIESDQSTVMMMISSIQMRIIESPSVPNRKWKWKWKPIWRIIEFSLQVE